MLPMVIMGRPDRAPARLSQATALGTSILCAAALAMPSAEALPTASDPGKDKRRVDAQVDRIKDRSTRPAPTWRPPTRRSSARAKLPAAQTVLVRAQVAAAAADRANAVAAQELEAAGQRGQGPGAARHDDAEGRREPERVAQFAAQIYQEQGFGQLDMALSSTDPQQFADRIALVDTVMDVQSETIERLATEQASLTALEDHLSALRADSAEKKKQAEAALKRAQGAHAAAKAKADLDRLAASQAAQARTVAQKPRRREGPARHDAGRAGRLQKVLKQRAAEAKRRAEAARRAAAKKRSQSSGSSGSADPGVEPNGYLSRLSTGWISSEFGMRFHPSPGGAALGTRLRSPCGSLGARRERHDHHAGRRRLRQPRRHRPRPGLR